MSGQRDSWTAIPQSVRDRLRAYVFERDEHRCRIQGPKCTGLAEELDHIIPRHLGGAILDPDNCRASCEPCNRGRRYGKPRVQSPGSGPASREW